MNKQQISRFERENMNKLTFPTRSGNKMNTINLNTNNSIQHELMKCKVAFHLQKKGYRFYTEAEFSDGSGLADLYDLRDIAFEITHSETKEHALKKKYPVSEIRVIDSKKLKVEDLD